MGDEHERRAVLLVEVEQEPLDLVARPLFVERLDLIDRPDPDHATLEMVCGKGGYVRSIARDLGAALNCHGHVRDLRRLWSGPFNLSDAISLSEIDAEARTDALDARLVPLEAGLGDLPEVRVNADVAMRLQNGNPAPVAVSGLDWGDTVWASQDGHAIAVGTYKGGQFHPTRVFVR